MPSLQGCLAWRAGTDPVDPGTAREQERRERRGRWVRRGRILAFKGAAAHEAGALRARLIIGEYRQLEEALWREIERAQGGRVLAQATVIAPSGRLVRHLKQAAAHRFPEGLFGVRFAHVFQFALDLAGDAGGRFVPDVLFYERLLLRCLESPGERPFAGEDVRTYDLAGALHAAIRDMKDAAVPCDPELLVDALRMATGDPASRLSALDLRKFGALLAAYRHYAEELRRLGVADRSDIFRAARPRAPRSSARAGDPRALSRGARRPSPHCGARRRRPSALSRACRPPSLGPPGALAPHRTRRRLVAPRCLHPPRVADRGRPRDR